MSSDPSHISSYRAWGPPFWWAFSGWSLQYLFCIDFSWLLGWSCQTKLFVLQVCFCTLAIYSCGWRLPCFLGKGYPQMVTSSCHLQVKSCLTCSQILWILLSASLVLSQRAVDTWKEYPTLHRNCRQFFMKVQDFCRGRQNLFWCLWNLSSSWESVIDC